MSRFWQYFHDRLAWPPIFRPGPVSALVKGLALVMDDAREDILWLRRQWSPATADQDMLVRYGESRGITRGPHDTDETFRQRVVMALAWHKLGGKIRGLERVLAENDFAARVHSLDDPDLWAHFFVEIVLDNQTFDPAALEHAFWLANEYKPGRSILSCLTTKTSLPLPVFLGLSCAGRTCATLSYYAPPPVAGTVETFTGLSVYSYTKTRIKL